MNFLVRLILSAIAVVLASYLLPGVSTSSFFVAIIVAAVLGFLNAIVKPVPNSTYNTNNYCHTRTISVSDKRTYDFNCRLLNTWIFGGWVLVGANFQLFNGVD